MKLEISFLKKEKIVYAISEGLVSVTSIKKMAFQLIKSSEEYQSNLLLIDHTKLTNTLNTLEIFEQPKLLSNIIIEHNLSKNFKIAIIANKQFKGDFRFLENVYRNNAFQLSIFTNLEQAKKWLINQE